MKITKQQIENWKAYESVRAGGAYNMFDPRAREATGLERNDYIFCMAHYDVLKAKAGKAKVKAMTKAVTLAKERPMPIWGGPSFGICPNCQQDIRNESKLRNMAADNYRLREMLKEAWLIGSIHNKPTFEQLNAWRAMLNKQDNV